MGNQPAGAGEGKSGSRSRKSMIDPTTRRVVPGYCYRTVLYILGHRSSYELTFLETLRFAQ